MEDLLAVFPALHFLLKVFKLDPAPPANPDNTHPI
jgi:hypothetical protein